MGIARVGGALFLRVGHGYSDHLFSLHIFNRHNMLDVSLSTPEVNPAWWETKRSYEESVPGAFLHYKTA